MFSVTICVVLSVTFVSQGQNTTTVSPTTVASKVSASASLSPVSRLSSSTTATFSSASVTQKPPEKPTCVRLGVTLDLVWDEDYENKSSERYQNTSDTFVSALEMLYNDRRKYKDVNVSNVKLEKKDDKVFVEGILCLFFVGGDEDVIADVFRKKVKTGKLSDNLPVMKDSAEVEPQGVSLTNWEAKEGECDKCEGAGGPFGIVRECEEKKYSCKGQETTKETDDCTTYCPSTAAPVTVSVVILAIGIFLSSSFQ